MPTQIPAAPGRVRSRYPALVRGTEHQVEVCLAAALTTPDCSGPLIRNWSWSDVASATYRQKGDLRWGQYAVVGSWDGVAFTLTRSVPVRQFSYPKRAPFVQPTPSRSYTQAELEQIAEELMEVPGALVANPVPENWIAMDVVFDDGTLQAYVDDAYGADVVLVNSSLQDVSRYEK